MSIWIRLRSLPVWVLPTIAAVLVLALPQLGLGYSTSRQIQLTLLLALVASGLNLCLGYAGELAVGQAAIYAGGAYAAGLLSRAGYTELVLQLIVAVIAAVVIGLVSGVPGLRLGGWTFAMTSFFLVLLVPDIVAIFKDTTGGHNGLSGILSPTFFGNVLDNDAMYYVIAIVTIIWFVLFRNIVVSRHGIALRVLKQSPILASSMGLSVYRMKLMAYAIGAIPAGLAGTLFANLDLYISPEAFSFTFATTVLAASFLGGAASVYGALLGAAILQFGLNQSTSFQEYSLLVTGAFLVIAGVFLTGGLTSIGWKLARKLDAKAGLKETGTSAKLVEIPNIHGRQLRVDKVAKSFGGVQALSGVSMTAEPGQVTALIGPNGSGKTTLLNMVSGFYRSDSGTIELDSSRLDGRGPDHVARKGVSRTFQTPNIPEQITVLDTVVSGRYTTQRASVLSAAFRLPGYKKVSHEDHREAERVLALVGLSDLKHAQADSLPLGMRRMLEVARCLIAQPGVLLLDEVASGLDEDEVERLAEVIKRVASAGGTIVLVEHNFELVLRLADDIYVLAQGELIAHGDADAIENDSRVLGEYLGVDADSDVQTSVAQNKGRENS